jgi:aspartate/methionine/tyrosine aminotransferase
MQTKTLPQADTPEPASGIVPASLLELPQARPAIRSLQASRIREVANAAMGRADVLAFWFGEPDAVTPAFIRDAAKHSLDEGETFYGHNLGARVDRVGLHVDPVSGLWSLDLERLLAEITPQTRAVIINSPSNPTGWVMPREQMQALLAHCRRTGTWIVSDEAYGRLVFDGSSQAPSMLDLADPHDRLIVAHTFSKSWQMTGWRLGWLVVPPSLIDDLGKLIEYNTSCAPAFVQQAGLAALRDGEPVVQTFVRQLAERRDVLIHALRQIDGVQIAAPQGAMYAFFQIESQSDSLQLAKTLVREQGLGLAPGSAFGPEGEGYLRWCFAKPPEQLREGAGRLRAHLQR